MRGKVLDIPVHNLYVRITPAYAGKSLPKCILVSVVRDHPCVCGEKVDAVRIFAYRTGSPLRMRGKVIFYHFYAYFSRITPAYAGKSGSPAPVQPTQPGSPLRMRGKD